jgi:hypothetical protein
VDKRNLTLSLPQPLVRKAKELAVREERSLNEYVKEAIQEKISRSSGYTKAMERQLKYLEKGVRMESRGRRPATRDELHGRR